MTGDWWLRPLLHAAFAAAAPGLLACRLCDLVVEEATFDAIEHYRVVHGGAIIGIASVVCIAVVLMSADGRKAR
jgi:hypothetical protein